MASRTAALAAINEGLVTVDGVAASRPSQKVLSTAHIEAVPVHPYVSRGALKLIEGLAVSNVDPDRKVCLDIGASTGGFTEVLLERGAAHVFAVDVGQGQLHPSLKYDARVTSLESTDARHLSRELITERPSLIVVDASFIGLEKLLGVPLSMSSQGADLIALFKPQFQVGRANIGKNGIVTDEVATREALSVFVDWLSSRGWSLKTTSASPVLGGDGNREYLVHARDGALGKADLPPT